MSVAAALPRDPARTAIDRRAMATLSAGHMLTDMCQGAVPALLPFFAAAHGWSYGRLAALVLAATVSSSIVQPVFGHLSDQRSLPWLMPVGVALGGTGIALSGLMPSYGLTFAAIVLSGLGVAAFHPEGSRYANYVSGARRATGMSYFSVGGNAGFALGPMVITPLVLLLGLRGTAFVVLLQAAMALVLWRELGRLRGFRPATSGEAAPPGAPPLAPDAWGPFARLTGVIGARSVVYFGLQTFVPLFFVVQLHTSKAVGNTALTVMLVAGAVGTLVGGRLADRIGRRAVLLGSSLVLAPLILALQHAGPVLATVLLGLIGAATIATFSVTVVLGQEYLPKRIGVASGVTLGLAIGLGGAGASALGLLADAHGVDAVMRVIAAVPLVAIALVLTLPGGRGAAGLRRP